MNTLLVFLCVCAFTAAKTLTPQMVKQYNEECIHETGISRDLLAKVRRSEQLPDQSDDKYKEYLVCFYKRQDYMNDKGTMLFDNIRQFLDNYYTTQETKSIVDPCRNVTARADMAPKDTAYKALECLMDRLKALDNAV